LWRRQLEQQQQQQGANSDATGALQTLDRFLDATQIVVRFVHVEPQVQMMDIKTGLVGKFVSVKGNVVKARPKRLRVATADFSCQKCGASVTHAFDAGRYSLPTKCVTQQCRSKAFSLIRPTARYINVQDLRLQEAQEESTNHAGRTPRQMEVELAHDLVDAVRPGDSILMAATVAAINTAFAAGKTGKRAQENSTFKLYLHGHSVTTMSESNQRGNKKGSQVVYTQQQLQNITQLCHADHRYFGLTERRAFPFDLLVRSLCPSIIGHNQVKAGLLLCLLGGTPPSSQSNDKGNAIRSNSHILIVGDPGTYFVTESYCGRSTMHRFCFNLRLLFDFAIQVWAKVKCCWPLASLRSGVSLSAATHQPRPV
jgi:DNA helicase MCM8